MKKAGGRVKARRGIGYVVAKSDPEALAAALRANLTRRKARMRAAQEPGAPVLSAGTDEEGDVPMPDDGAREGAWVSIGSRKI